MSNFTNVLLTLIATIVINERGNFLVNDRDKRLHCLLSSLKCFIFISLVDSCWTSHIRWYLLFRIFKMWKYPVILISRKRFIDLTFTVITILFVPVLALAVIWTWCVGAVGVGVTRAAGFTFVGVCKHSQSKQNSFFLDNIRKTSFPF